MRTKRPRMGKVSRYPGRNPKIVPEFLFCLSVGPLDVQIKLCIVESAGTRRFPSRISLVFEPTHPP